MPKIPTDAVVASIQKLAELELTANKSSALEAYLVAKRMAANPVPPSINECHAATVEMFVVLPNHPRGRIKPFLSFDADDKWLNVQMTGRATVWNVSTRNHQIAQLLFAVGADGKAHVTNGFRPDALAQLAGLLGGDRPDVLALKIFLLRDQDFPGGVTQAAIDQLFMQIYGLTAAQIGQFTVATQLNPNFNAGNDWDPSKLPPALGPQVPAAQAPAAGAPANAWYEEDVEDEVLIDDRVREMVVNAIMSNNAVVLVGPPGTGKSRLLDQVIKEIAADPAGFGFEGAMQEPLWATPDEGWTTRDLLGGETIVEGNLKFSMGLVLRSLKGNRWLVLDELNRADMDRIFGGLFTWLSGKRVTVGRTSTAQTAHEVELGWNGGADATVEQFVLLSQQGQVGDRVRFDAGKNWRLLGTYNALDAHRVFRLGHALGRRFVRVPIPPATPAQFEQALTPRVQGLPDEVKERIAKLYRAHYDAKPMGPAIFLGIPKYVRAALGDGQAAAGQVAKLVAEAYLIGMGAWLAVMEDEDRETLKQQIVVTQQALTEDDWTWLNTMLPALG